MHIEKLENLVPQEIDVRLIQTSVTNINPLQITGGNYAKRAPACLLEPKLGDIVICSRSGSDIYIISILERQEPSTPLSIDSSSGFLFQSPDIKFISKSHVIEAAQMTVNVGLIKKIADRVEENIHYMHSIIDSFFLQAKQSMRRIEDTDFTQSGHVSIDSKTITQLHGEVTLVSGENLVQLQSQQVHIG
jgi:hypothetical protein